MTLQLLEVRSRRCREQESEECLPWKLHLTLRGTGTFKVFVPDMGDWQERLNRVCVCVRECILTHILYPLLIIDDLFEPPEILLLERHQDHKGLGLVVETGVVGS